MKELLQWLKNQQGNRKIIAIIIAVLTTLLYMISCTTVLTTSKKGGGTQTITISTETNISADSASINLNDLKK